MWTFKSSRHLQTSSKLLTTSQCLKRETCLSTNKLSHVDCGKSKSVPSASSADSCCHSPAVRSCRLGMDDNRLKNCALPNRFWPTAKWLSRNPLKPSNTIEKTLKHIKTHLTPSKIHPKISGSFSSKPTWRSASQKTNSFLRKKDRNTAWKAFSTQRPTKRINTRQNYCKTTKLPSTSTKPQKWIQKRNSKPLRKNKTL